MQSSTYQQPSAVNISTKGAACRMIVLVVLFATAVRAGSYHEDTLAIRAIFDSNGISGVPMEEVLSWSEVRIGRVVKLNLRYGQCSMPLECPNCWGKLAVLPSIHIVQLDMLETLDITNNALQVIPDSIGRLAKLKVLNLDRNLITSLPDGLWAVDSLEELYLWRNNISQLPSSISSSIQLRILGLTHNDLSSIPVDIFQLTRLQQLYLDSNNLVEIPNLINALVLLSMVRLTDNRICSPSDTLLQWLAGFGTDSAGINHQRCEQSAGPLKSAVNGTVFLPVKYHAGCVTVTTAEPGWGGYVCDLGGVVQGSLLAGSAGGLSCRVTPHARGVLCVVLQRGRETFVQRLYIGPH